MRRRRSAKGKAFGSSNVIECIALYGGAPVLGFGCDKTGECGLDLGVMGEFCRKSDGSRSADYATDHAGHKDLDECAISRHMAPLIADFGQGFAIITFVFAKGYFSWATLFLRKSRAQGQIGQKIL